MSSSDLRVTWKNNIKKSQLTPAAIFWVRFGNSEKGAGKRRASRFTANIFPFIRDRTAKRDSELDNLTLSLFNLLLFYIAIILLK